MEANDAKTGVHCPRPWLEPESGRERGERETQPRENRRKLCSTGGSMHTNLLPLHRSYREEEEEEKERERRGEPRFVRVHAGYERMEEYRRRGGKKRSEKAARRPSI